MVRLDKFLCDCGKGSRAQVKKKIRSGLVRVNGQTVRDPAVKIMPQKDTVVFDGSECVFREHAWFMLHKPAGVISATRDGETDTVLSLLKGVTDKGLFPVGRLDIDTTGLLLLTNDGTAAHRLLAPKRHVDKVYLAGVRHPLSPEDRKRLEEGVEIGDGEITLPAKVRVLSPDTLQITIHEGRYHQVKRMLLAVDNEVLSLKRIAFGPIALDEGLAPGAYRELTEGECRRLRAAAGLSTEESEGTDPESERTDPESERTDWESERTDWKPERTDLF